ncbi:PAS domain-containing sensor histidine kinase [Roseateles koreensis]|uniref:histidine kinase n=1 Tax=Roseateles koreensis TaxID=2987526 RepID=A0ABT5KSS0_9BURK|nr:ATP-binding protein [Roseateles koreensis]MDC8785955.1 ATP-binding protein [Roseateles koreensis]
MNLSRLLPKTLVARVFLLYSSAMLLFVGVGFGLFVAHIANTTLDQAGEEAEAILAVVTPAISDSAVIGDYDSIQRSLNRLVTVPIFNRARFIDIKGALLEVKSNERLGVEAPAWLIERFRNRLDEANATVVVGGKDYGVLRLTFGVERIAADIWRETLFAMVLAFVGLCSGVILVWFPLKHWLGNLGRIQAFGEELGQAGGHLSHVIDEAAPLEFRQTFEILNKAAVSLQVERAQAAVTLDAIADGVATVNLDGCVVLANPILCRMLEKTSAEILGQPLSALLPSLLDDGRLMGPWRGRRVQSSSSRRALQVLEASLAVVLSDDGHSAGWVLALRDVTDQQQLEDRLRSELAARSNAMASMRQVLEGAEAAILLKADRDSADQASEIEYLSCLVADLVDRLQAQASQLNAIFSLSPDGFVSFDDQRRVQFVSPAFEKLTGIGGQALLTHDEKTVEALIAGKQSQRAARPFHFVDLTRAVAQVTVAGPPMRILELALHRGEGHEVSQVLHVRDITHHFEVDRMKSEFLSTAAHELRTPMTSIHGFTELLMMRTPSPGRLQDMLGRIHRQSVAMNAILDELLDLSRIEARRGADFVLVDVDLIDFVRQTVGDFRPPDGRPAPQLQLDGDDCCVRVDRGKMQQTLRNLLSNAYKYSPEGGSVVLRIEWPEPGQVCLSIQDHGIGMSAEELSHVTERFYRADKSGAIPGTGLGMSIVKEIVELHGGQLKLESQVGQGTTVSVLLPTIEVPAITSPASLLM